MRVGIIRLQRQRPAMAHRRLLEPAAGAQHVAEVGVCLGIPGSESRRILERRQRVLALRPARSAHQLPQQGIVRVRREQIDEPRFQLGVPSRLHQREQRRGVGRREGLRRRGRVDEAAALLVLPPLPHGQGSFLPGFTVGSLRLLHLEQSGARAIFIDEVLDADVGDPDEGIRGAHFR